jgi:hypothetical protein
MDLRLTLLCIVSSDVYSPWSGLWTLEVEAQICTYVLYIVCTVCTDMYAVRSTTNCLCWTGYGQGFCFLGVLVKVGFI